MKYTASVIAFTLLFSASSFAAKQITREESSGYTKIGDLSVTQTGTPTVGHKALSKQVDKKCQELGEVKASDCYYLIIDSSGNESNHKNINIEVFKK